MKITRKLALKITRYLIDNPKFYFPFFVRCKGIDGSEDYVEVVPQEDDYDLLKVCKEYDDFILVENLQHMYEETIHLMSKGFIEKIVNESKN